MTDAAQISDNARNDAITNAAIVLVALLTAFILAGMVARQMSRSMASLRTAAFGIAEQRLPMLVDQLSRTEPGRVDTRVQPIPIDSRDEIGEVARAFDQVHREAVRLAAEQAMLRGNVNAIFTNLSRRNQSLIEGQLTLISDLENREGDPDQLNNLFKLDHLATRMRRNGENLLVLAGEEPGRRWNEPVPLVDVLRAASSEVESYERIELSGVPETEIHGQAVTDLVHLLAELLENATTFSSPQTKVRVTATRLPDGRMMIEIHDKGIGLTAEDFADINHKLANPPTVDASVSQRMGLFVVEQALRPARHPGPAAPLRRAGRYDLPGHAPRRDHARRWRPGGAVRRLHGLADGPGRDGPGGGAGLPAEHPEDRRRARFRRLALRRAGGRRSSHAKPRQPLARGRRTAGRARDPARGRTAALQRPGRRPVPRRRRWPVHASGRVVRRGIPDRAGPRRGLENGPRSRTWYGPRDGRVRRVPRARGAPAVGHVSGVPGAALFGSPLPGFAGQPADRTRTPSLPRPTRTTGPVKVHTKAPRRPSGERNRNLPRTLPRSLRNA